MIPLILAFYIDKMFLAVGDKTWKLPLYIKKHVRKYGQNYPNHAASMTACNVNLIRSHLGVKRQQTKTVFQFLFFNGFPVMSVFSGK